jgi:uncharacterized protein YjbI with pentapeptide repeats
MANEDHLSILAQGVKFWNGWKMKKREDQGDLSYADLRNRDLSGVRFGRANLKGANLTNTNLTRTHF